MGRRSPGKPTGRRRSRLIMRLIGCLVCAALMTAPVTNAFALDKNQIIQMSKLGLDDRAIKGAIDSAGGDLELTPEEIGELRLQGVSEEVIDHLKQGGHIKGEKPQNDVAPPPPPPGHGAMGPAPAPAPSDEESDEEREEREREAQEREQEILRKAEELNEQKRAEQERQNRITSMANRMPRAEADLKAGRNMQAARFYLEFFSLEPEPDSKEWYKAKFGLAKALFQEGILSGASSPLLEVLMAGADKPHFEEAFGMLNVLTRQIGYQPPILEELTRSYIGDKNERFQNTFNYYMGKFFFDYNRTDLAMEYLRKVDKKSKHYPASLYLTGVAYLDEAIDNRPEALRHFERAILAGEAAAEPDEEILQLSYLALARVFYEVGLYDIALFYYQKIPASSARHAHAVFEMSWSYFMKNDFKRALGTFHTLHSDYFSHWYLPDLYILEATAYLNLCKFPQSQRALAEFQEKYLDLRPRLQKFLEETATPEEYWNTIVARSRNKGAADEGLPSVFVKAVMENLSFYNTYQVVRSLQKEKAALEANIASLGEFGQEVLDRVNEQLQTKIDEGGILVQQRLTELDQDLQQWELAAMQISFDIDNEEREQLQQRLINPDWEPPVAEGGTTLMIVADDWQPWPFEGEYWHDEVSNYRSRLRTECVEQ